jgi:hypothetical protein
VSPLLRLSDERGLLMALLEIFEEGCLGPALLDEYATLVFEYLLS